MEGRSKLLVKRYDFLDSNLLSGRLVQRRTHNTVCALADDILDVILLADVEGDLAGTALRRSARHVVGNATGVRHERRSRKRRERKALVGEEVEVVSLLSNLAWARKERWRGEAWSAFVVVVEERCLSEESLSPVTATSDQQCPKACPTCGMQHAQSVLQSTCIANQPLPLHSVSRYPANAARLQRDVTYSFFLVLFCDCVNDIFC